MRLEFNEPVSLPTGGLRVFDDTGERIDSGDADTSAPGVVRASQPAELSDGTDIVTWQVTSADGHPVKGAFVFQIGQAGQVDTSLVAELFDVDADRPFAVAATIARWTMYAGVLMAAGAVAFLVWVSDSRRPPNRLPWPHSDWVPSASSPPSAHSSPLGDAPEIWVFLAALSVTQLLAANAIDRCGTGGAATALIDLEVLGDDPAQLAQLDGSRTLGASDRCNRRYRMTMTAHD